MLAISTALPQLRQPTCHPAGDISCKCEEASSWQMCVFYLYGVGIGGIKSSVSAVTVLVHEQDKVGRSWGYGLSSAATFLAFLVFLSGTKRYRYRKCVGSLVIQILQILVAALRKMKVEIPTHVSSLYEDYAKGTIVLRTNRYCCLDKASIISNVFEIGGNLIQKWNTQIFGEIQYPWSGVTSY
ncbi:hypothetical protein AB3S75_019186 [Citrus x aurantiifolia]